MLDKNTSNQITNAITKMEEALTLMKNVGVGIRTQSRTATQIMKYISNSGNETWKIYDTDEDAMYLRQSNYKYLVNHDIAVWMETLELDEVQEISWELETVPDGDFIKIVQIESEFY